MARVFKQRYTQKMAGGTRATKQSAKWYIEYRDGDGIKRRVPGFTDKRATEQLAAKLEREASHRSVGLIDRYAEHRKQALAEHVTEYEKHQRDAGSSEHHIATVIPRIRKVLTGCRFAHWQDITALAVEGYIADLKVKGRSIQTCNFYLTAVKSFCRWMIREGRAPDNPLQHLQGGNVRIDRRQDRRALDHDELRMLIDNTRDGPTRLGMTGVDRALVYTLTVNTGLRANEIRTLTPQAFDLDADPPTLTVSAAYSKHRRDDALPLRVDLVPVLRRYLAGVALGDIVFRLPDKPVKMLRADLAAAREAWIIMAKTDTERRTRSESGFLVYRDDAGRVADFHALRHTFITNLARGGVHPKLAQALARHSTITLTMDRYSHTVIGDQADALEVLPDLTPKRSDRDRLRATGTESGSATPPRKRLPLSLPHPRTSHDIPMHSGALKHCPTPKSGEQENTVKQGVLSPSSTPMHPVAQTRRAGLEPATFGSVDRCSIQLS